MTGYGKFHPDYDSIKAESDAEVRAERRRGGWCPTCRHNGHSHGCPDAPEQPETNDDEETQPDADDSEGSENDDPEAA
jgi:hypothetical protein